MANQCNNCRHLQLTKTADMRVAADCGAISSRIICGKCKAASEAIEWSRHRQRCPVCDSPQGLPPMDDYRMGHLGTVSRNAAIPCPEWCHWFEADPMIAAATTRKQKPQPTLF